jgi:single-stranded DNA-binding protein
MFEQITVIGTVGKVTKGEGENPYLRMSVGISNSYKDKKGKTHENTNWYGVTLWNEKQIDYYKDKIQKGDCILAIGRPEIRTYTHEGENRVEVTIKTDFGGKFRVIKRAVPPDPAKDPEFTENE